MVIHQLVQYSDVICNSILIFVIVDYYYVCTYITYLLFLYSKDFEKAVDRLDRGKKITSKNNSIY